MGKMKLYCWERYRSVRAMWLIKEMGVEEDFEYVMVKPGQKDCKELDEYTKKVHPHGTIPALESEDGPILESGAMCLYLADKYAKLAPDVNYRKDYYDWSFYANVTMDEMLEILYQQWVLQPIYDDAFIDKSTKKLQTCLGRLEKTLSDGRRFICGSSITAADCILGYCLHWTTVLKDGFLLDEFEKVTEYHARLKARPAYQEALAFA